MSFRKSRPGSREVLLEGICVGVIMVLKDYRSKGRENWRTIEAEIGLDSPKSQSERTSQCKNFLRSLVV